MGMPNGMEGVMDDHEAEMTKEEALARWDRGTPVKVKRRDQNESAFDLVSAIAARTEEPEPVRQTARFDDYYSRPAPDQVLSGSTRTT